ncbi:glycosyl hydrolase [Xylariaceae sp. FL0804]|nr:glycosyl hydrolase [Xylariaceae sp. FL0804]
MACLVTMLAALLAAAVIAPTAAASSSQAPNSTFSNPILPGFHPDPSCIFVPEWDRTFFCASSSFNAFPGIPLHASRDLQNWKLVGHVLNRPEQLPRLVETNRSTRHATGAGPGPNSGIWAPTIRYHDGTFWVVTTLVDDDRAEDDPSRWDNVIFRSEDPYDAAAWSLATGFVFEGYDTSPVWEGDGKTYIVGSHNWEVYPALQLAEADLSTGEVGEWKTLWNGTGGEAPEGPHIYQKDGWYYLLAAEGGTGLNHMVTMARSRNLHGPYEGNPLNPVLTNANTTSYYQTVGHADLFQDPSGNWWAVALSTRSGPGYLNYPMGRETVLTPVTWGAGAFPAFAPVAGETTGWAMPPADLELPGPGLTDERLVVAVKQNRPFIDRPDVVDFAPGSALPAHFTYWRFPVPGSYAVSPEGHPDTLRLLPSRLNLTALNGNYAGPAGQTFVGRRQEDTLFTFSVDLDFAPASLGEEAGVSAFLTQNHHLDLGVVMLPAANSTTTFPSSGAAGGTNLTAPTTTTTDPSETPIPQFRFRGISYTAVPDDVVAPVPAAWLGRRLRVQVRAANMTHYSLAAGPADAESEMATLLDVDNAAVSWGFTGVILGIYCTSNGYEGDTPAYFSRWRYEPQGQYRS